MKLLFNIFFSKVQNWHDTGKVLIGANDALTLKRAPSPVFGARLIQILSVNSKRISLCRLRPDQSQADARPAQNKLFRSPSLSSLSPSATITKPIKYSYHNYGSGTFDQSTKHAMWPRVYFIFLQF